MQRQPLWPGPKSKTESGPGLGLGPGLGSGSRLQVVGALPLCAPSLLIPPLIKSYCRSVAEPWSTAVCSHFYCCSRKWHCQRRWRWSWQWRGTMKMATTRKARGQKGTVFLGAPWCELVQRLHCRKQLARWDHFTFIVRFIIDWNWLRLSRHTLCTVYWFFCY